MSALWPQNSFDDAYLGTPNLGLGLTFSILVWIKQIALRTNAAGGQTIIVQNLTTGVKAINYVGDGTGDLSGQVRRVTSVSTYVSNSQPVNPAGQWYAIMLTYDDGIAGNLMHLYVGTERSPMTEVAYASKTDGVGALNAEANGYVLGNGQSLGVSIYGRCAFVGAWSRVWSLSEARELQRNPLGARNSARVFAFPGSFGSDRIVDRSGNGFHASRFVGGDAIGPWADANEEPRVIRQLMSRYR